MQTTSKLKQTLKENSSQLIEDLYCIRRHLKKKLSSQLMRLPLNCLISRISDDLFVHKKTFLMSHILEIYKSLLPKDVSENYQSTRLQCKLASYYAAQ